MVWWNSRLPVESQPHRDTTVVMRIENQLLKGMPDTDGKMVFLFTPKAAKTYAYTFQGDLEGLDGKSGSITSYLTPEGNAFHPSPDLPHWWGDDPSREVAEDVFVGAKTVSRWREEFLADFAQRLLRCRSPKGK